MNTEPYRPSNGTEGDAFEVYYCERCKMGGGYCPISFNAYFNEIDEPDYPKEWVRIDGDPTCTAFVKADEL